MTEPRLVNRMRLGLVALLACVLFPSLAHGWYNPSWAYRQEITILPTLADSNLSGFPYLVKITDGANPVFANALTNGDDIVFTSSDGSTKLAHELEKYDSTTNELYAWVRVPSISSTVDTVIYMYYGNGSVTASEENVEGTWDNDFVDVQHLQETSGTHFDSTSNNNDATPLNGVNQNATGQIDGANQFDGSNDKVDTADSASLRVVDMTVEAWIYVPSSIPAGFDGIVVHAPSTNNWYGLWKNSNRFHFRWSTGSVRRTDFNATFSPNQWYYVAGVLDVGADQVRTYQNDTLDTTINGPSAPTPTAGPLYIGHTFSGSEFFPGIIDEVRISRIARSDAWIKASARNQGTPDTYQNLGPQETTSDADIALTKADSADPVGLGSTFTYNLTATNNGPGDATLVTLVDTLDAAVTFQTAVPSQGSCAEAGGIVTCDLGGLANGSIATVDITVTAPATPQTVTNTAVVSADEPDPDGSDNTAAEDTTVIDPAVDCSLGAVTTTTDSVTGSALRACIIWANGNPGADTITVPAGTYNLTLDNDLLITEQLTINGANESTTIVDGQALDRVFDIDPGITVSMSDLTIRNGDIGGGDGGNIRNRGNLSLTNVTVRDGTASKGGGIHSQGAATVLTLGNVTVTSNTADNGAGIYLKDAGATLTMTNGSITNNTTGGSGGGIYSERGDATLTGVTVSGNTATNGGGVWSKEAEAVLDITDSVFSQNTSNSNDGGAIFNDKGSTVTIDTSTFDNNTGGRDGGALYSKDSASSVSITNSTFSSNQTNIEDGGAIFVEDSTLTVNRSTLNGNIAARDGGALWTRNATTTLTNMTISGNSAPGDGGGGIYAENGTVRLDNVTLASNAAASGGGIFVQNNPVILFNTIVANSPSGGNCSGSITSLGTNLDSANTCGLTGPGDLINSSPNLGLLQNNGGLTQTHALGSTSAAIDTGNNTGCPATDQRGVARPLDGDGTGSAECDIGAYEAPTVLAVPTITLSKSADVATAKPGDTITYTLTYGNSGAGDATNLVITDTIPANTTLVLASITGGGAESGGVITWNLGPLAAGQVNRTVDFTVTVDAGVLAGAVIDNDATANFDDSGGAPQTPVTSDTLNVTVDQVGGVSVQPDQSGTVRSATGSQLSYTFTVTNAGNGNDHFDLGILKSGPDFWIGELYDATGTVLMAQDADADGTWDFVNPAVDFDADGQPDTGTMAAGATLDVILRLTVPAGTTPGDRDVTSLTATSNFDDGFGLATATSVAVSGADTPVISFTKTDTPDPVLSNDTLSYAFTYDNTGTKLATGVVIVDSIPAGAAFVSSSAFGESGVAIEFSTNNRATWGAEPADPTTVTDIRWIVGNLNKNRGAQAAGFDVQPDIALPDGSILVNSATLGSNELPDITVTASTTVRSAVAFTNSTKTVMPMLTSPGATLLYTIFVTNSGAGAGTNVVVTDLLPLETSYVPGSITGAGADDSGAPTLTWNLGVIPAGTTIGPLTYQVVVNNPVAANTFFIQNIASIDSNETLPANTTTATTVLTAAPLFSGSTKTSQDLNAGPLLVGDTIEYRVDVINTGDMNATGVIITDIVPADTTYVPGSITGLGADDSAAPNLTWNIGNLAVGVPSVATFRVTVNGGVPIGTQISNLAQIASDQTAAVSTPPVVNTVGGGATGSIQSTSPIVPGANVLIRITDADLNTDIATLQSFSETTTNTVTGETELLVYTETGPNTGTFEATVLTVFGIAAGTNDDGAFNVQAGDTLETTYNDALTSSGAPGSATATTVVTGGGSTGTLVSTTPINPADIVTLTLTDADLDVDPGVAETTSVTTVNSVTGESETLLYTETGVNTAVFSANVATVFGIVTGTDNDGTFNVQAGDSLVSIYNDALTVSGGPGVAIATTDVLSAGVSGTISSTPTISPSDVVTFTLTDADLDTDPGVAETVILTTTNSVTGESEALLYTETGVNTGLFTASVATVLGAVAGTDDDGTFNVQAGDSLVTIYNDAISDTGGPASDIATTNVVLGSADLMVLKSVVTVRDPLGAVAPAALAIPGGTIEYEVSVTNSGNANATEVIVTDTLNADLSFLAGDFDGGTADVEIIVGAAPPVYCIAEVDGDTNTDGCFLNAAGDELTVTIPVSGSYPTGLTVGTTAPDNVVVVHFRATVN